MSIDHAMTVARLAADFGVSLEEIGDAMRRLDDPVRNRTVTEHVEVVLAETSPGTAGTYRRYWNLLVDAHGDRPVVELNRLILSRSDVVSFHCYAPEPALRTVIGSLAAGGRPLVCTEWLARPEGSTIELLEVFKAAGVGAINWGLVDGRTQTRLPWRTWWETVDEDEPWFHELLRVDGSPYDVDEIAVIRSVVDGTNSM